MNNEHTKDLTDSEKLDLILADMADVKTRLAALEAFNEDHSRDTRPMLAELHSYVANLSADTRDGFAKTDADLSVLKDEAKRTRREVGLLREDIRNERAARAELAERVEEMERRPS